MKGDDLTQLVDFICATWNISYTRAEKKAAYQSWNRYVGKFEYNDVMDLIDRHALTTKWAPRPPEIRNKLIDPDLPTDQQAYMQAIALKEAVAYGTDLPPTHPLVAATAKEYRGRMTERGFVALWEEKKADHLMRLLNDA